MPHYQGHLSDGSSIQKHSASGLYPCVIYAQETPTGLQYGLITPNDQKGSLYNNYQECIDAAIWLKEVFKWSK